MIDRFDRSLAVFVAVHLRTDGKNVVAQKLERSRGNTKWDIHALMNRGGALRYESKFD